VEKKCRKCPTYFGPENVVSSVKLVNENLEGKKWLDEKKIGTHGAAGYPNELVT
jgi:hypothetical protein